jgi:hypothetical protein
VGRLLLLGNEVSDVTHFKVGDRVKCMDPLYSTFGKEGIVQGAGESLVLVKADGYDGTLPYDPHEVEAVPVAPKVDSAISLYALACERYEAAQLELDRAKDAVRDARLALRDALDGEA